MSVIEMQHAPITLEAIPVFVTLGLGEMGFLAEVKETYLTNANSLTPICCIV